jgi:hypothetical protein
VFNDLDIKRNDFYWTVKVNKWKIERKRSHIWFILKINLLKKQRKK